MQLDHLILNVIDREKSLQFYKDILEFTQEADDGPFAVLRVNPDLTLQLAPWGTQGGEHLAFALKRAEFLEVFSRIQQKGVPYGDAFDTVGNMQGPGDETGARGLGKAVYFFDPNRHLLEIRCYEM